MRICEICQNNITKDRCFVCKKKYDKERYLADKPTKLLQAKIYYQNNKDYKIKYQMNYYQKNKETILPGRSKKYSLYKKNRIKNDISFKLSIRLRQRVNEAIKNNKKAGSAVRDLGCTLHELKTHLEKQFKSDMTWENYGYYGWHIDHIIPLASFDLTNREEFLKACHYTNLQPLWWQENLSKGAKAA